VKSLNGSKTLRAIGKYEDKCQKQTEKALPRMGKKAPVCYEYLGQVLAYADMIGSCSFGCPGPSHEAHAVWYLVARASSYGRAALRLAKMGFYDEALNLVRSIGEIANLFELFDIAPGAIEEWKKSDRSYRLQNLSPAKIRRRLIALNQPPVMDEDHYASLCEVSTHPVPQLRPQQFNHVGRSMAGGVHFQEAGFLVVLNEIGLVTSLLVLFAAKVCKIEDGNFREISASCAKCAGALGAVDLGTVQEALKRSKEIKEGVDKTQTATSSHAGRRHRNYGFQRPPSQKQ
jgi:hypothetical protein